MKTQNQTASKSRFTIEEKLQKARESCCLSDVRWELNFLKKDYSAFLNHRSQHDRF